MKNGKWRIFIFHFPFSILHSSALPVGHLPVAVFFAVDGGIAEPDIEGVAVEFALGLYDASENSGFAAVWLHLNGFWLEGLVDEVAGGDGAQESGLGFEQGVGVDIDHFVGQQAVEGHGIGGDHGGEALLFTG